MTTKQDLHRLIDELPESAVAKAGGMLAGLVNGDERLPAVLRDAPLDDEPLTEEDIEAIRQGREDIEHGRTVSNEELRRELGW